MWWKYRAAKRHKSDFLNVKFPRKMSLGNDCGKPSERSKILVGLGYLFEPNLETEYRNLKKNH